MTALLLVTPPDKLLEPEKLLFTVLPVLPPSPPPATAPRDEGTASEAVSIIKLSLILDGERRKTNGDKRKRKREREKEREKKRERHRERE